MTKSGILRITVLSACLLFVSAAAADTIYKYRRADGRTVYSNRLEPGLELIESFEYRFPEPALAPIGKPASKSDAAGEERIRKHLDALQAAWTEVQEATRALAAAEQRLSSGIEPHGGEREAVAAAPSAFAPPPPPPDIGGPVALPPSVGGVPASSSPAVGGAMSGRRGRAAPEYVARMEALEVDVRTARTRLDTALRKYNELR